MTAGERQRVENARHPRADDAHAFSRGASSGQPAGCRMARISSTVAYHTRR